jgi:ElaB/YqjD/DUF883 family membrane-anchored ribosome-binding protein
MATSASSLPSSSAFDTAPDTGAGSPAPGNGIGSHAGTGTGDADLFGRVVQGAHATIDRLAETAAPHVHRLQDGMAEASDSLQARAGQARETGGEWAETLRCTVRENPLAAVATALAVGLLVARLTR